MTVCRNEAMNNGTGYPKSCPICKFSGVCSRGVERVQGAALSQMYYVPVAKAEEKPMSKYGVVVKKSYQESYESRGHTDYSTINYNELVEFETEAQLVKWIEDNNAQYTKQSVVKYVKFEELKAEVKISVSLK